MQTKLQSLIERTCDLGIGMTLAVGVSQTLVLAAPYIQTFSPRFQYDMNLGSNIIATLIFTVFSFGRGYFVRRAFNSPQYFYRFVNRYVNICRQDVHVYVNMSMLLQNMYTSF